MKDRKYVIVCSDGTSHDMSRRKLFTEYGKTATRGAYDLQDLIEGGWTPVRETAMGGGDRQGFAIILLEKEGNP